MNTRIDEVNGLIENLNGYFNAVQEKLNETSPELAHDLVPNLKKLLGYTLELHTLQQK